MKTKSTKNQHSHTIAKRIRKSLGFFLFLFVLSGSFQTKAQMLVPFAGSNTLACGTNTVLRDHANFTTYANNANGFTVLDAGLNAVIAINGNYITESGFDYVRIYNGAGIGGAMLLNVSGTGAINFTSTPGQTVTVQFISDGSVVMQGFNLNIVYSGACFVPCSGAPGANSVITPTFQICPNGSTSISLLNTYTTSGFTYSWVASTTSPVGPFVAVPNGTTPAINSGSLTVPVWYQCVITCTNGGASITTAAGSVSVAATTTNSVPYNEGFEGVPINGTLPNCSWATSSSSVICQTHVVANTLGRLPRTGSKFAAFFFSPAGTDYFYTNGIQLNAGVTYSAGLWYRTESTGFTNWTDLSIMVGNAQTPAGLSSIVSSNGPAVSTIHKALGGVFTVPVSGLYYVAIKATRTASGANYLSWDDLSVTVPCNLNTPSITVTPNSTVVCAGTVLSLAAAGGNTYLWNDGSTNPNYTTTPFNSGVYTVIGTSTLSGCSNTISQSILVNPSPAVSVLVSTPAICAGSSANLIAFGANTYFWSNTNVGNIISVSPAATANYTVTGTNQFGCAGTNTIQVKVNPLPNVTASASNTLLCQGDALTLTGGGALTYQWSSASLLTLSNPVNTNASASAIYSCTGTDANGCSATAQVPISVNACLGTNKISSSSKGSQVFPNPNYGEFTLEMTAGSKLVEVMDLSGRIVLSTTTTEETMKINIESLAGGIYYVKIKSENVTDVVKVIKN